MYIIQRVSDGYYLTVENLHAVFYNSDFSGVEFTRVLPNARKIYDFYLALNLAQLLPFTCIVSSDSNPSRWESVGRRQGVEVLTGKVVDLNAYDKKKVKGCY